MTKHLRIIVNGRGTSNQTLRTIEEDVDMVFVKRGETFKITCLEDVNNKKGFFLLVDNAGRSLVADEITIGDTVFTTDCSKRTFSIDTLEHNVFLSIKSLKKEGAGVEYMPIKDIQNAFNEDDVRVRSMVTSRTIANVCVSIGFRKARVGEGWAIVVSPEELKSFESKFVAQ